MCVDTMADWDRVERREFTPVELKHIGWGPRFALIGLTMALIINVLATGMAYQRLVDNTNVNSLAIERLDNRNGTITHTELLDTVGGLSDNLSRLAISVATQTTTIEFIVEDIRNLELEVRALRDRQ